jgi:hypothetical protein
MSVTWKNVENAARRFLGKDNERYFTDELVIVPMITGAVRTLHSRRPDTLLASTGATVQTFTVLAEGDKPSTAVLPVPDDALEPLGHRVAAEAIRTRAETTKERLDVAGMHDAAFDAYAPPIQ